MTRDELIERLKEWDDVEFKRARNGVPEDAYTTVSAFANTSGGWLIFGVKQEKGQFVVSGVEEVDKVQNDFLSCLRAGSKLNRSIDARGDLYEIEGKSVIAFHIPELPRTEKPVYLKGDPRQSFIRRGGGDERCTPKELERFLRDASTLPFDSEIVRELDPKDFYDERALAWYRRLFNEREPGRHEIMEDLVFLREWGFLSESEGNLCPTRAAVLLLGKARHVRRLLPRPVVDFQIIQERFQDWSPDRRWSDRIVVEDNIIQAWLAVVERYMKHADRPFEIDVSTLRRHDEPPDYISFREAAINLLIHQDYGDVGRHAQIQMFRDRTRFWNPGDAFGTFDQLLEPGAKEVRNPNIVAAFRRIGLSDQAGMGIRAIFGNWRRLGNVPPLLINQRAEKAFELSLLKERLLSDNQKRFQKEIGVHLRDVEADVFAFACRENRITLTDARAVGGLSTTEASALLDHLVFQKLLEPLEDGKVYSLAAHLRQRYLAALTARESGVELATQSATQLATQSATQSGDPVYRLLRELQNGELSSGQLRKALGIKHRPTFRQNYLHPALESGMIEYTIPEKPQSRLQKYRLSDKGRNTILRLQDKRGKQVPGS